MICYTYHKNIQYSAVPILRVLSWFIVRMILLSYYFIFQKQVYGGLPPVASELLPLCRLGGRATRGGGDGYPEKDSQLPGHQVEAVLLEDVWIRQD